MKKKLYILLFLFSAVAGVGGLFLSCNSDDDSGCVGVDCLPEATQTGQGSFGCLVNGEPFVDKSGSFNCFYQLVDGEYFFNIASTQTFQSIEQIGIRSWMKEIEIGEPIELQSRMDGNFFSEIAFDCICPNAVTSNQLDGFIIFNEFTVNPNVVSARFEFTVTDPNTGTIYEITDGRFDSFFTQ